MVAILKMLTGLTYLNVSALPAYLHKVNYSRFTSLRVICMDAEHYEKCKSLPHYRHIKCFCESFADSQAQSFSKDSEKHPLLSTTFANERVVKTGSTKSALVANEKLHYWPVDSREKK